MTRPLLPGIYAATPTFFHTSSEELDLTSTHKHTTRLITAGIIGLVVLGSNGEAPHLNTTERKTVITAHRTALNDSHAPNTPIIVGCSASSVKGTIELCYDASAAGGDYALVLPPCYFKGGMSRTVIRDFYFAVAADSPIPVMIYSFPGVSSGIELDSDLMIEVSQHPNIVGTKFTCGDTGKLNRVASTMDALSPTSKGSGYIALAGLADFILPALVAGATGVIAGGANIAPKSCVELYDRFVKRDLDGSMELQRELAVGDWVHTKMGIAGTKSVLQEHFGYGGLPRRPLTDLDGDSKKGMLRDINALMKIEMGL